MKGVDFILSHPTYLGRPIVVAICPYGYVPPSCSSIMISNCIFPKAPILKKQREDYEQAMATIEQLSGANAKTLSELEALQRDKEEGERKTAQLSRENLRYRQETKDLSQQVRKEKLQIIQLNCYYTFLTFLVLGQITFYPVILRIAMFSICTLKTF